MIPHTNLLNAISIALIPISLQLPHASTFIKWMSHLQEREDTMPPYPISWIPSLHVKWGRDSGDLFTEQLHGLMNLQKFIDEIEPLLSQLMECINDFVAFKEIQGCIYSLQQAYADIPYVETELAILTNKCLIEQPQIVQTLLYYLNKVLHFIQRAEEIKHVILRTRIHSAADNFSHPTIVLTDVCTFGSPLHEIYPDSLENFRAM